MPKAKRFTAHKSQTQSYSTNPETSRIQEIEQSRVGLDAEITRIRTKYRTRLSRRKSNIRKISEWKQLSKEKQIEREGELKEELRAEEEEELRVVVKEWMELTDMKEETEEEGTESVSEESGKGIDDTENLNGICDDEIKEEENNDEMESNLEFEDEDFDASDNEDLFDGNGNKIQMEDLIDGMRQIYNRHMKRIKFVMKKYKAIERESEWESMNEEDEE
jgi:hypothetical protein